MIRNQWYVILESREVGKKVKRVTRMGEQLVLRRTPEGSVNCLVDRCCHRGVALSAGELMEDRIRCPFHGLEYDGNGSCSCIPANTRSAPVAERYRVPSYPVCEKYGWVWIWWGEPDSIGEDDGISAAHNARISEPVAEPVYFDDINATFSWATVRDPWEAHYSRVLENQLDVVHLPFVHNSTIGRGNRTVVDGPGVEWIGERMLYTYVFNRTDDGTPPKKPHEVPVPPVDREFKLELIMPNLWQNHISARLRIVAAFVPVDENHTMLYLRTYQNFMRAPLLRQLTNWIFGRSNLVIAHQDRRVVQTQVPPASRLHCKEQLIQGDLPIIEYRKKRQQLQYTL